jgi:hypothetical protein
MVQKAGYVEFGVLFNVSGPLELCVWSMKWGAGSFGSDVWTVEREFLKIKRCPVDLVQRSLKNRSEPSCI